MAIAPKAMAASSSPRFSRPCGNGLRLVQDVRAGFQQNRAGGKRQQNAGEHGEPAGERNRLVMDFALAGVVHELDAQAPFAPERQREQRRQKRAREGGEKIVEGKGHDLNDE